MKTLDKISKNLWRAVLLLLAVSASTGSATAQTWQTVLVYQPAVPKGDTPYAGGTDLAADELGNVFCGGGANAVDGKEAGQVLQTTDTTETTWVLSDDSNTDPASDVTVVNNLGFDSNGNLYSVGQLFANGGDPAYWYVRKSANGGATWTTVDLFQYSPGASGSFWADATGFCADNLGNIYVVGGAYDANIKRHWLVRKSSNGGTNWANVDDVIITNLASSAAFVPGVGIFVAGDPGTLGWTVRFSGNSGETWATVDALPPGAGAFSVASDSLGNIYAVGLETLTKPGTTVTYFAWITRESVNGGATWKTVDTYTLAPYESAVGHALGVTAAGTVVAVGQANDASGTTHWIAREPNSSGVWQTVDNYQLASGDNAAAQGVVTDAAGNLLVTGSAVNGSKGTFWVVRKLP